MRITVPPSTVHSGAALESLLCAGKFKVGYFLDRPRMCLQQNGHNANFTLGFHVFLDSVFPGSCIVLKLSTKCVDGSGVVWTACSKIRQIIDTFGSHLHIELQQRGVEFSQLFRKYEHLRPALLERMPPMETARPAGAGNPSAMTNGETEDMDAAGDEGNLLEGRKGFNESETQDSNALLVLLGGADTGETEATRQTESSKPASTDNQDLLDLLGGLDLSTSNPAPVTTIQNNNNILFNTNQSSNFLVDGLLNSDPVVNSLPNITAYEKNGLKIIFSLERLPDNPNTTVITMSAMNETPNPLSEFLFQAAVPKTFQLQMLPPSGTVVAPAGQVTQVLRITNPNRVCMK
ncbi:hypothetical protein ANN_20349 [Periplaneta americana]|uniref:GAE domain-containing protein n=1 Tax=Periplaneta americana TaxID=6978 RepID=A0ABQ8SDI3_PERAM|nr:hypothetical protein ANN_20349 [Periplaneta americana]